MSSRAERRNLWCCTILKFTWSVYFGVSIIETYYRNHGLSGTQIFLLQTILAVSTLVSEVPCGVIADRYGLRCAVLAGVIIQLIQSVFFVFCSSFWQFCISLGLVGIGWSLISGTTESIMRPTELFNTFVAYKVWAQGFGWMIGIPVGGLMVTYGNASLPIQLQPGMFVISLAIALLLKPAGRTTQQLTLSTAKRVMRTLLVEEPRVRWLIATVSVTASTALVALWLLQPKLRNAGVPAEIFSAIYFLRGLSIVLLTPIVMSLEKYGRAGVQVIVLTFSVGCAIVAGLSDGYLGIAALVCLSTMMVFANSLLDLAFKELLSGDSETSATEFSISNAIQSLLFAVIAPLFGLLSDAISAKAVCFFVAGYCCLLGIGFLSLLHRAER